MFYTLPCTRWDGNPQAKQTGWWSHRTERSWQEAINTEETRTADGCSNAQGLEWAIVVVVAPHQGWRFELRRPALGWYIACWWLGACRVPCQSIHAPDCPTSRVDDMRLHRSNPRYGCWRYSFVGSPPPPPLRRKSAWRYSGSDEWRRARYWHRGLLSHVLAKSLVGVDRAFLYVTVTLWLLGPFYQLFFKKKFL